MALPFTAWDHCPSEFQSAIRSLQRIASANVQVTEELSWNYRCIAKTGTSSPIVHSLKLSGFRWTRR